MRLLLVGILFLSIIGGESSFGQKASLSGVVFDNVTKAPIPGVTIILLDSNQKPVSGTFSDFNGNYKLTDIDPILTKVQFRFIGYKSQVISRDFNNSLEKIISVGLEPANYNLSTVEILGTNSNVIRSLPGTATKIDKKEIELLQPMGTQELLIYTPGVQGFADDGMGNSKLNIGIRGLNPRRSSRVLVLEDGIPIQPALYLYANMYYNPPIERIDDLELIKGSGAIEYGPQTMGGVINYITNKPRKEFGGDFSLIGGTNNLKTLVAKVGGFGNERLTPEVQLIYKAADGYRENNHFDQINGTVKLNILASQKQSIYIKGNVNYELSNATYTGLTEYSFNENPNFNPKKFDEFEVFRVSLDVISVREINRDVTSITKFYTNSFSRDWWRETDVFVDAATYNGDTVIPVPYFYQNYEADLIRVGNGKDNYGILRNFFVFGLEQNYNYDYSLLGNKSSLNIGARVHFERFTDDFKKGFAPDARSGVYFVGTPGEDGFEILGQSHNYETKALSVFVSNKYKMGDLVIVPGIRFETFEQTRVDRLNNNRYDDKVSAVALPGLGLNYQQGKNNFFGGVHRGFTPPSSGTLKVLQFGQVSTPGLDLKAEKSINSELGFRRNVKAARVEVALFSVMITDLVAAGRGTVFKNLGKVQTRGLESAISLDLAKGLKYEGLPTLHLVYTYLETEIKKGTIASALKPVDVDISGNELPYAPRHTLTAGISKAFPFGLEFRTDINYVSSIYTDYENISYTLNGGYQGPIDGYYLLNFGVKYKPNVQWSFNLNAKN
ncbi:MAG: Fe(3+) dicitrate transport protein, partial [Sphingobacteriales bacterium]